MATELIHSELHELNDLTLQRIYDYQYLNIHGIKVLCPYFINHLEADIYRLMEKVGVEPDVIGEFKELYRNGGVGYGWGRGKGTPEEISQAVVAVSRGRGLPLDNASPLVIQQFMKLYGIGIDCSGFVYNILEHAFSTKGMQEIFINSLDWGDKLRKGVMRAGVFVFSGESSFGISPEQCRELDLVLIKTKDGRYVHIAIGVMREGKLQIAQSQISNSPDGISLTDFKVVNGKPVFGFVPEIGDDWGTLYQKGKLEFRRLKVIDTK